MLVRGEDEDAESRRDAELVRAAQRGSEEAVEALFRRHWRRAHRAAFLIIRDAAAAEDIAQEAFLAAMRALDRFDRRRPFRPWLHRIVVNRAIDLVCTVGRTLKSGTTVKFEVASEADFEADNVGS